MSALGDFWRSIALTLVVSTALCAAAFAAQAAEPAPPVTVPTEAVPSTDVPDPNEEAPTPGEVPPDRNISELDTTDSPPPAPEQRPEDRAEQAAEKDDIGPPIPEELAAGPIETCKEIQPEEDTVLHRVRRTLAVTACASSAWLDSMFGDQFYREAYLNTRGSLSVGSLWSEYDGFDPRLRARVRLQLPQWDQRISAFAGRVGEEDYISDTESEFNALPTRQFGGVEDESVLVGLGYSSPDRTGNDFDAGVGVRVDLPMDPYARARYEIVRTFAEKYVFRARETVFWQNTEGFGSTTRFNIDRALSDRFLVRWSNLGKYTEETLGVEWFSELTLFQKVNERTGIAWQNYVTGASDAEVDLQRFGARAIMRRQLTPEWLFLELRAGVGWPRLKSYENRDASIEAGIAFEMQFTDERL